MPSLDELPVGTVITIGHPGNGILAVRYPHQWKYLRDGSPTVDDEDFRAGWQVVDPSPAPQPRLHACPDDGACHHDCTTVCYRVRAAGPMSGWLREQGLDPSDPAQGWPEGTDPRPLDRREPAFEFCHHSKGPDATVVQPCLRTLDNEGRCPIHGTDVYAEVTAYA
jgi:hypothetical protein